MMMINCRPYLYSPCLGIEEFLVLGIRRWFDGVALDEFLNQSSKNLAAAPLLSPLMSVLPGLMDVPWVANQLKDPMLSPVPPSTNFRRVISGSTSLGYLALSSAGLNR